MKIDKILYLSREKKSHIKMDRPFHQEYHCWCHYSGLEDIISLNTCVAGTKLFCFDDIFAVSAVQCFFFIDISVEVIMLFVLFVDNVCFHNDDIVCIKLYKVFGWW